MEKVAVVLIDSFCAKLTIASVQNNECFMIIDSEKENLNLSLEEGSDYFLKKSQIDNAVLALKNFRKICEMHGVSKVHAIATFSANNKPKNIYSFFDEVFDNCGFRFNILTGEEQSLCIYNGIINTFDLPKGVICHISPEEVKFILYNRRMILNEITLDFGPLTLADKFPLDDESKEQNLKEMALFVSEKLGEIDWFKTIEEEYAMVGSGTYFEDITSMVKRMKKYPLDLVSGYNLNMDDADKVFAQIRQAQVDKAKKLKGINEKRADVFVASMIIALCASRALNKNEAVISSRNIIEGQLFKEEIALSQEKPISDVLGYCMQAQSNFFSPEDDAHNNQVYNLSLLLFRQLKVLHKLPRSYTKILRLASFLHDCGNRIGYNNHAKNGFNVILGADIYGVTHRELVLAGFAIAMHTGLEIPVSEYLKYHDLISEEDINAVKKLGIIVRMAEAFDRTKNNVIVDLNCDILGDSVIMKTIAVGNNSYEISKASECAKDFEKNFNKKIEIL
ncbi:MAG: hypothetical protein IJT25_02050 [Clostridia bacterium]|nr:hypothetical protein [Clostridia bacterium]